ncbi:ribosome biogenesis GTP-binding protein YihA/YsxC [Prevotella sp. HUN102]|uniref:ribosome biogenesis GTP-binding protein YihA/YsxC n=1 Tax=Prevotella sp. HUN102 TaxID=1392486 RepID=UPI00048EF996|nr:ribosome biogenesis GTP-binding protein YihA/YsxC [Prevotella sp. HUN102]
MIIKKSEFTISAPTVSKCPNDTKPEYAFIGRSNVGKSSLINMLCNHKGLAKTSSKPGKTLLINHFIINNEWYLVDLPGYGYAKNSKTMRNKLEQMITQYILQRKQLINLFVLIDIRHEQQKIDREFIDWLGESNVPFSIIFTKADKLTAGRAKTNALQWMNALKDRWEMLPPYFLTSAETKLGRDEVLDYIDEINASLYEDSKEEITEVVSE